MITIRTNRKAIFLLIGMLLTAGLTIPAEAGQMNTGEEESVEFIELFANQPTLDENGVLTGCQSYNKGGTVVDLSNGWEGKTITQIGKSCFDNNDNITKVILPATVTSIGQDAFWGCDSLKTVEFVGVSQLSYIGDRAFLYSGLSQFTMPDSVTSIGENAFGGTDISDITIPQGCNSVGQSAFSSCQNLVLVKILNPGLKTVGNYAFDTGNSKTVIYGEPANKAIASDNNKTFQRFTNSLSITQMPSKAFYYVSNYNSSELDKRGLRITANYASSTAPASEELDLSDCTFSSFSATTAGTKTVTVSYGGAEVSFNVDVYYDFSKVSVNYKNSQESYGMNYNGTERKPEFVLNYDGLPLKENEDYRVEYSQDVINAGEVTVKFIATERPGGYKGEKEQTYTIRPKNLTDSDVTIKTSKGSYDYTGSDIEAPVTVTVDGAELVKDRDYKLEYRDNTQIGRATVIVTGINNCSGQKELNFNIVRADISKAQKYTGKAITPSVKVTYAGRNLKKGTDYTVAYSNNKK